MDLKKELAKLHPLERTVAPHLKDGMDFATLVEKSKLKEVEAMRALQWLENKAFLKIEKSDTKFIVLTKTGESYKKNGLPEIAFLKAVEKGAVSLSSLGKKAGLSQQEMQACLGLLKKKAAISLEKGAVSITDNGKRLLDKPSLEAQFLSTLKGSVPIDSLKVEEKHGVDLLKKRGIVEEKEEKHVSIKLTADGKKLAQHKFGKEKIIDRITPALLESGEWKTQIFRAYDVEINVPKIHGGKRHFVKQAIEYAKQVWLDMGFKEMSGPMLNTSFWNFDALFTAQDHPVRELQDTFYIAEPGSGSLPPKKFVEAVKKMHEHGGDIGSTGWNYSWDPKNAQLNVMRTHTTVLSALTLASLKKEDLPGKYFALGRCFRNETVDWSHLFEFNQTEGIVIDPDANFSNLLGYLKQFFSKMGFPKARFRPAYFPYTEPSVEIDVFHPIRKEWIELGGAGIFRPEVVIPLLGEDIPVLAWGPGFDRIIMDYYGLKDLRDMYGNDLKQMREMKLWTR